MKNLEYDAKALRKLKRRLDNAQLDMLKVGPKVGNVVARHIRRQFATKGAHFGTPWKPLKPATIKEKVSKGFPRAPLVRTGGMKIGVTKTPLDIEWFTNTSGHFGTDRQTAIWQHGGTKRNGKRVIPPRPILRVTREIEDDVVALLRKQALGIRRRR